MTTTEVFEVAQAILLSLGGGAGIVFLFSSWLGKVWANRLLAAERAKHEKDMESYKNELKEQSDRNSLNYRQKIDLYKGAMDPIVDLIVLVQQQGNITGEQIHNFDKQRLAIVVQLAMFSPKIVFDKYSDFIDYLYNAIEGKENNSFSR